MKTSITKVAILLASALTLHGCASHNIQEYDATQSRAWNLVQSVGMDEMEDNERPKGLEKDSMLYNATGVAIDSALWTSDYGLGLDWSAGIGLGLLQSMGKTYDQGEQSTLIAWVPEHNAQTREEAMQWITDSLNSATIKALKEHGMTSEPKIEFRKQPRLFSDPAYIAYIEGEVESGTTCFAEYRLYSAELSDELQKIPSYIAENSRGYRLNAGGTNNPEWYSTCRSDKAKEVLSFSADITKHLPGTIFTYRDSLKHGEHVLPQRVMDHGRMELFILPE